jgi:proline iminopeptidase
MVKHLTLLLVLACASAQAQDTQTLTTINGAQLYVRTLGSGDPLIVVHGGPGLNHAYLLPHLESLAKNHKLVFYDQRACGRSRIPAADSLRFSFWVGDLESLRLWLGVEKMDVLAHSWGALPAVAYAQAFPQRINKMILSNPVPLNREYDQGMVDMQRSRFTASDSTDRAIIMGSPGFKKGKAQAYEQLMLFSFRHSFADPANLRALALGLPSDFVLASGHLLRGLGPDLQHYDWYDEAARFTFPLLIVHGKADIIPLAPAERLRDQAKNARLAVFERSGHFPFVEERKKFVQTVHTFLK